MPKKAKILSAQKVANLKEPGRHSVGGVDGLYLDVSATGFRAWVLRVIVGDKRRDIGLGGFPFVSLAEARDLAFEMRKKIRNGIDPVEERKANRLANRLATQKTKTFEECANDYIDKKRPAWGAHSLRQWTKSLARYVYPKIGSLPVSSIDTALVLSVLQQEIEGTDKLFWYAKTETASRVCGRIESILDQAKISGFRTGDNPARWEGHLEHVLPSRSKLVKVAHYPALPYDRMPTFIASLRQQKGAPARALELGILTGVRSNEVRGMKWGEIDDDKKLWIIPAARMKMGREHRVPLSEEALRGIEQMRAVSQNELVFPGVRGQMLTDSALTSVIKAMDESETKQGGKGWRDHNGERVTVHGFRSTFRDWAGETTSYPREVCEHALAHKLRDGVEAAYQRGDMLEKRARMMDDWARFCCAKP